MFECVTNANPETKETEMREDMMWLESSFYKTLTKCFDFPTAEGRATCRNCVGNDCTNNILEDILQEKILTSGYFDIKPFFSTKPKGKWPAYLKNCIIHSTKSHLWNCCYSLWKFMFVIKRQKWTVHMSQIYN